MLKKMLLGIAAVLILALLVAGWQAWPVYDLARDIVPGTAPEDYALQDDSQVRLPEPQTLLPRPYDPLKNVYWGELHVHTTESLDAILFGTTATIEDAYRFPSTLGEMDLHLLGEFAAHEQQLLAGMREHETEIGAQVGELLPVVPRHSANQ